MSNTQIIFQFIGWALLLLLSNRALRRTELSRLKDQLVDQIEQLSTWLEAELENKDGNARSLERAFTGKISRIDLLLQQLNGLARRKLINEEILFEFWNLDIDLIYSSKTLDEIKLHQQDAIEVIETSYHTTLFKINFFRKIYLHYHPEIYGAICTSALLYFLFNTISIFYD